ncbi:MAG: hypothetical protein L6R42_003542 [Xanthoria sp. 1 TBL-2021]|nr:MAG: hypothetical protein L6R42_003542 [Xanthoria sp. 1 TBL-2021]
MARLNEPPAQVEVNSTQSIRIRTLESEISRLLSENIALREEVIRLQFEIDNHVGLGNISTVKARLEAKLLELGGLVQELGNVQQSTEDRRALRRRSGAKVSPKTSPDQRNWKNALTISEVTGGADGRLPPIVEDKYYPRRTLDADELGGLISISGDPADSPDLGPPPVAHFDAGDPIKFDANQQGSQMQAKTEKEGDLNPVLFANLETRRKRRGSSQRGEPATDAQTSQAEGLDGRIKPGFALKSGAKRKFTAKEEEEQVDNAAASEGDDFHYNRNPIVAQPHIGSQTKPPSSQKEKQVEQRSSEGSTGQKDKSQEKPKINTNSTHNGRNILAPKSVNTDPVSSPVKPRRPPEGEKPAQPIHDVASKPRERSRSKDQLPSQRFARPVQTSQFAAPSEPNATLHDVPAPSRPPPEPPAPPPLDVLSPDGSAPRTARSDSRDTPPPEDLDPETATTNSFGSMGRSSRRGRGSVSYAEPNLRDKMRRPTKELVDAVAAEERLQQRKNLKAEVEGEGTEPLMTGIAASKMRTVVIKKEPTDDDIPEWKAVPAKGIESDHDRLRAEAPSPLGNKAPPVKANLPASVVTERRRRPSILDREQRGGDNGQQDPGAGSAIAALMTSNPKTKSRENSTRAAEANRASRAAETPIIESVPESCPAEADNPAAEPKEIKAAMTRSSRRHSSISDDRVKDALARRVERRKEGAHVKNAKSSVALGVDAGAGEAGRGERAASRRRSMML